MANVLLPGAFVRELPGLDVQFQSSVSPATFPVVIPSAPGFTEPLVRPFNKATCSQSAGMFLRAQAKRAFVQ